MWHTVLVRKTSFIKGRMHTLCGQVNSLMQRKLAVILTHWGRVTHICISKLTIIGSDNGLSPCRHQAIIWTNAGILLIGPLGTNFNEIVIEIQTVSLRKMRLKMSSAKRHPFCLGLNVLNWSLSHIKVRNLNHFLWNCLQVKMSQDLNDD